MTSVEEIRDNIRNLEADPLTNQILKQCFSGMHYKVFCQTCGTVFLDLPYDKFIELHPDFKVADTKWCVEAVLHFCQNPSHQIVTDEGGITTHNFSETWIEEMQIKGCSIEQLYNFTLKKQKEVRGSLI